MNIYPRTSGNATSFQRTRSDTVVSTGLDYSTCRRVDEDTLSRLTMLQLPRNTFHPRSRSDGYQYHSIPVDNQADKGFDFSTAKSIAKSVLLQADSSVETNRRFLSMHQDSNSNIQTSRRSTESSVLVLKIPSQHRSDTSSNGTIVRHNNNGSESSDNSQNKGEACLGSRTEGIGDHIRVDRRHAESLAENTNSCSETLHIMHSESQNKIQRKVHYASNIHHVEEWNDSYLERTPPSYHSTTSSTAFLHARKYRDIANCKEIESFSTTIPRLSLPITSHWSPNVAAKEASLCLAKDYKSVHDVPIIARTGSSKTSTYISTTTRNSFRQTNKYFRWGRLLNKRSSDAPAYEGISTTSVQRLNCELPANYSDNKDKSKPNPAFFRSWLRSRSLLSGYISNGHINPTKSTLQVSKSPSPIPGLRKLHSLRASSNSSNPAQGSLERFPSLTMDELCAGSSQGSFIISDACGEEKPQSERSRCRIKPIIDMLMSRRKTHGQVDHNNQDPEKAS